MSDDPYAAPLTAESAAPPVPRSEAEATRMARLSYEAAVRVAALPFSLVGVFAAVSGLIALVSIAFGSENLINPTVIGGAVLILAGGVALLVLAGRIRRFDQVARVLGIGALALGIVYVATRFSASAWLSPSGLAYGVLLGAILGLPIVLLTRPTVRAMYTPEYRRIIAATPHLRYRASAKVWIAFSLVLASIVLTFLGLMRSRSWY